MGCAYAFEKFGVGCDMLDDIYQGNDNGYLFKRLLVDDHRIH